MKVIIVLGLFGGIERRYYQTLAKACGSDGKDFLILRAGSDWNPQEMAEKIRQIEGRKRVICLSLGALVGNIIAGDTDTEVYYMCPYLGAEFMNRANCSIQFTFRHVLRALACILVAVTWPFKWHCWYPLWGGCRPDKEFLSLYAVFKQLRDVCSAAPKIIPVDGVVYSLGDTFVEPEMAKKTAKRRFVVKWKNGGGPSHCKLSEKEFGAIKAVSNDEELGNEGKAYIRAFSMMLSKKPR